MSNCYTHTCFVLVVTAPEAALIRQSIEFCNAISDEDDETIADLWAQQTPEFQAVYRAALIAVNGPPPEGYALKIKANPHDFGTYYTVDLHCPTDQALERQDYEAAIEHELAHWRDALMPAPIDYSGNTPTPIDPNNPARRAIVRAIIASRPLSDGRFPTAEIATININLREEFPDLALEADAALSPA
jgi:hypothetical protein